MKSKPKKKTGVRKVFRFRRGTHILHVPVMPEIKIEPTFASKKIKEARERLGYSKNSRALYVETTYEWGVVEAEVLFEKIIIPKNK